MSKNWFGIITNENNMSATYRKLLKTKNASYRIIGKLRDNKERMIMIKFVLVFDEEVNFFDLNKDRYGDVYNTIIPIDDSKLINFIEIVKLITFIQSGIDPETKLEVDDEEYYSSDDSAFPSPETSDDDEEEDDDEEDEDEEDDKPDELRQSAIKSSFCRQVWFLFQATAIIALFFMNYNDK